MLDLYDELKALVARLTERNLDFALCGGLAMAVHGLPRATLDIDLLVPADGVEAMGLAVRSLGYGIEALPMRFADGAVEIHRLSKADPDSGDLLSVGLLLVSPRIDAAWMTREVVEWEAGRLPVVSREGLILLKSLRNSGQDRDDIRRLRGEPGEA